MIQYMHSFFISEMSDVAPGDVGQLMRSMGNGKTQEGFRGEEFAEGVVEHLQDEELDQKDFEADQEQLANSQEEERLETERNQAEAQQMEEQQATEQAAEANEAPTAATAGGDIPGMGILGKVVGAGAIAGFAKGGGFEAMQAAIDGGDMEGFAKSTVGNLDGLQDQCVMCGDGVAFSAVQNSLGNQPNALQVTGPGQTATYSPTGPEGPQMADATPSPTTPGADPNMSPSLDLSGGPGGAG